MVALLTEAEIKEKASQLSDWEVEGKTLRCQKKLKNFIEAIAFANKLVDPAEAAGHHPDLEISYNKVTIYLTTHDAGGLTEKDFALAKEISEIK